MDPSSSHQHRPTLQLDTSPQRQQQGQRQGQGQQQQQQEQPTEQPFHIPDLSSQLAHSALSSPSQPPTLAAPSSQLPQRSFSPARRAQSMKEQPSTSLLLPSSLSSSTTSNSSASNPPISGLASVGSSSVPQAGRGNEGSVLAGVLSGMEGAQDGGSAATTLARRNNTVSTASSRLVRLERTRARLALQGAGLSEEDQNFYVPPSPARGGPYALNAPWSDIGHGASSSTASLPLSGGGMAAVEGEQAWRRAEQMQQQQQAQSQQQQQATMAQQQPAQSEPKRSSFVVLRGGKGDSALTERRSHQPASSISSTISPPLSIPQSTDSPSPITVGDQPLRHKNSLKPFLEQERAESGGGGEGGEVVEDWERGLMDERRSAAEGGLLNGGAIGEEGDDWRNTDPYATLTTPPLSSSFPSQLSSPFSSTHARANTVATHQTRRNNTTDPWLPPSAAPGLTGASVLSTEEDPNLIRRHQSLTSFRQREPSIEQTMGVLSSSPGQSSWADHSGPIDEHSLHHHHQQPLGRTASGGRTAYGSLALGAAPSISGFGSRMRSGTSPAPLTLHHSASLGHNAAPRTPHAATAGLAHSNSLSSHPYPQGATGLSHSDSLGSRSDGGAGEAARRVISPVMNAFPGTRSPWSPTEEETKQLSLAASSSSSAAVGGTGGGSGGSLSRGGSGSSRGSHATGSHEGAVPAYASLAGGLNGRFADEVRRLDEGMGGMQLGPPGTPSSSSRAPSTSPQPPPTANNNAARRLPPLMTGADVLLGGGGVAAGGLAGMGMAGRAGPASAAAFVPPIGHSHFFGGAGGLDGISENGGTFPPPPQQQQQQNGFGGPLLPSAFSQQQLPPTSFPPVPPPFPDPTSSAAAAPLPPAASSLGPLRGNFTAHPGAPSSLDWARQKEFLLGAAAGATPTSSAFVNGAPSSAATVVPGPFANTPGQPGADWPSQQQQQQQQQQAAAGGGGPQNVDLATLQQQLQLQHVQQQQQINMLQSQMAKALSAMDAMRAQGAVVPPSFEAGLRAAVAGAGVGAAGEGATGVGGASGANGAAVAETPIDVNGLVAKKGYNPAVFDLRPKNARFFVIKSYTEEDVHKSLKYEIWASTDLGNKRLDRAFRESADKGPIYLFFSVNASGHFAGMAQMLTPVDYSMSSNVWASDKWKGVLKVRWIYIKDVPLSALRHIRLSNTPENKPVTSSRDTQEVPYDAGLEVLRIIASYQSRTSLLQDYAWYEASSRLQHQHQAQAAAAQAQGGDASLALLPPQQGDVPLYQPGHHYQNHQQNQHNQHNNHGNQHAGASGHSTPSPQPPSLAPHQQQGHIPPIPPSPHQPQTQPSPKQAPRNAQAGGRRFWNRSGGGGGGGAEVPPVPPVPQQQQQGYYQAPPHLQQQMQMQGQGQYPPQQVGNGMAY